MKMSVSELIDEVADIRETIVGFDHLNENHPDNRLENAVTHLCNYLDVVLKTKVEI